MTRSLTSGLALVYAYLLYITYNIYIYIVYWNAYLLMLFFLALV